MSNCEKCGYYSDGECNICGMGMSGEDTFCRLCKDNPNCYYKQLSELKAENERLKEDYLKLYQQKDFDNVRWQKRCTDLHIEDKAKADKYLLVLQEIKEKLIQVNKFCTTHEGIYDDKCIKVLVSTIIDLITKVEDD